MKKSVIAALFILTTNGEIYAHGDIHERIHDLSHSIKKNSADIDNRIRRGQLYLESQHPEDALIDFDTALKQNPKRYEIHFYRAQAQLALGNTQPALDEINIFLQQSTSDAARARGLLLRGDIYVKEQKFNEAALDYTQVIEQKDHGKQALPDDFVRVADTYLAADPKNALIALDWLNRGIKKLGSLAALEERALAIEITEKQYAEAMQRLDRLIEQGKRVYYFYDKKGEVFALQGDNSNAEKMYQQALDTINTLPVARKNTPAMIQFKKDIEGKTKK